MDPVLTLELTQYRAFQIVLEAFITNLEIATARVKEGVLKFKDMESGSLPSSLGTLLNPAPPFQFERDEGKVKGILADIQYQCERIFKRAKVLKKEVFNPLEEFWAIFSKLKTKYEEALINLEIKYKKKTGQTPSKTPASTTASLPDF